MTPTNDFTFEEIERMRALVHRADQASKPIEFDLNNPPRETYVMQHYPRCLYRHDPAESRIVQNEAQEAELVAAGWSRSPVAIEVSAPELDGDDAAEAAAIDAELLAKKIAAAKRTSNKTNKPAEE